MRRACTVVVAFGGLAALVACVGGPGQLPDQGTDQTSQGGGVQEDPSGGSANSSSTSNGKSSTTTAPKTPTTIAATEFSRDCKADTDCVSVYQGGVCTPCQCPNTAIASTAQKDYQSKLADRAKDCPKQGDVACTACAASSFACTTGKCTFSTSTTKKDGG